MKIFVRSLCAAGESNDARVVLNMTGRVVGIVTMRDLWRRVPVVNAEGELLGLVGQAHLLRAFSATAMPVLPATQA